MGHVRHPLGTLVVSAALAGTAAPVMAQLVKPFSVDRDYISVVRPTDVTEHFSLDVITSAPAPMGKSR